MKVVVKDLKSGRERAMSPRYADLLSRIDRGRYLTTDMRAQTSAPAQPAAVVDPAQTGRSIEGVQTTITGAPPAPMPPAPETDSAGATWDSALHVATKSKNSDGTWRKRPGSKAEQE